MSVIKFSGKSRFKLRCDTTANWESANPVLLNGEIGIEQTADGSKKVKIGDGVTEWVNLGYTVDSALSATSERAVANKAVAEALSALKAELKGEFGSTLQAISDKLDGVV